MVEVEVEVEEATTGGDDETKRESETPLASLSDWELADDELSFAVEELSEDCALFKEWEDWWWNPYLSCPISCCVWVFHTLKEL